MTIFPSILVAADGSTTSSVLAATGLAATGLNAIPFIIIGGVLVVAGIAAFVISRLVRSRKH